MLQKPLAIAKSWDSNENQCKIENTGMDRPKHQACVTCSASKETIAVERDSAFGFGDTTCTCRLRFSCRNPDVVGPMAAIFGVPKAGGLSPDGKSKCLRRMGVTNSDSEGAKNVIHHVCDPDRRYDLSPYNKKVATGITWRRRTYGSIKI